MKDLRRNVRRYKRSCYLREKLRDDFMAQAEAMRARMHQLCTELGDLAVRATPEGDIAREFDKAMVETVEYARSAHFDDALQAIAAAGEKLQVMEDAVLARKTIADAEREFEKLEQQLAGIPGIATGDFRILLARARSFYEQAKYQTARVIASEVVAALVQLELPAGDAEAPPSDAIRRIELLEGMASQLESWGIAGRDCTQIRALADACRRALTARRFELSRLLLADAEADKAQISVFLHLMRWQPTAGSREPVHQLLGPSGDALDWCAATNRLLADFLGQVSDGLQRQIRSVPARSCCQLEQST